MTLHHFSILLFFLLSFIGHADTPLDIEKQREKFLLAEEFLKKDSWKSYSNLKNQIPNYPLYPYLKYQELEKKLYSVKSKDIDSFIEQYSDTPLTERIKKKWLERMAKEEKWFAYLRYFDPTTTQAHLKCDAIWAKWKTKKDKNVLRDVLPIWLSGKSQPGNCDKVFAAAKKNKVIQHAEIWQRVKLAIKSKNLSLAKYLAKELRDDEVPLVDLWIKIHKNPELISRRNFFSRKHPAIIEMLVYGLNRIADIDVDKAIHLWIRISDQHPFSERHWALVVRSIALNLAQKKHPDALSWLCKIPPQYVNDNVHEWRIRSSIFQNNWHSIVEWYKELPEHIQREDAWKYWNAKALQKTGQKDSASTLLTEIAKKRSFYGFLASQHLNKKVQLGHVQSKIQEDIFQYIKNIPGIVRAKELHIVGKTPKGRIEWMRACEKFDDIQKNAAAKIANEWDLPNWSIMALADASNKNDLQLRFPLQYSNKIIREANRNSIDPAWVFALTRQESAFVSNARSPVGALGLMQIMPTTARVIAKKHNIKFKKNIELLKPEFNIKLGTKYMNMLSTIYDNNPILATAAYNAGPTRVKRWLPKQAMDSDIWIEGIPFRETRDYVKNIFTYTLIYQDLLGLDNTERLTFPKTVDKSAKS